MAVSTGVLSVDVASITREACDVLAFELVPTDGNDLPAFTAGAHVDIHLPNNQTRSYSLVNSDDERHRYVIVVRKDPNGRGGSVFMHDSVRPGMQLYVGHPKNHFPLIENAVHVLLIAGGIGITPILGMIRKLEKLRRSWELFYCARTPEDAAFYSLLQEFDAQRGRIKFVFDYADRSRMLDIGAVVKDAHIDTHLYCCGPAGMLDAFEAAASCRLGSHVHVERFSSGLEPASTGGFIVELARSKRSVLVSPGQSILGALGDAGISVPHSCKQGVCGTCETAVIEGNPDHRDLVLNAQEKASNRTMMICCSGCHGEKLVLDL